MIMRYHLYTDYIDIVSGSCAPSECKEEEDPYIYVQVKNIRMKFSQVVTTAVICIYKLCKVSNYM